MLGAALGAGSGWVACAWMQADSLILRSTKGFVARPVAWQILTLPFASK